MSPRPADPSAAVITKAVRGVLWASLSQVGSKLFAFLTIAVLARFLSSADFGQVAIALTMIAYIDTVGDLGLGAALIYERRHPEQAANLTFLVGIISGAFWFTAAHAFAGNVAAFFGDPAVEPILRTMAWVFPCNGISGAHDAILRRDLAFRSRLVTDLVRASVKTVASLALVFAGWGVWAVVWGHVFGIAAGAIALWLAVPWRPGLRISRDVVRRMFGYGRQIVAINFLASITHHVDYVVVGRMLGSAALGFYSMGYRIPEIAIAMVIRFVGVVAFPAYSKLRDDPAALQRAFLGTSRYVPMVTIPAAFGLAVLAWSVVPVVFGPGWEPSIPILQILALSEGARSLSAQAGQLYQAVGQPHLQVRISLVRSVVLIPALIFGARWGILGVAFARLAVAAVNTGVHLFVAARILALPPRTLIAQLTPTLLVSSVMLAVVGAVQWSLAAQSQVLILAAGVITGVVGYAAATWMIDSETVMRAWQTLRAATVRPQ